MLTAQDTLEQTRREEGHALLRSGRFAEALDCWRQLESQNSDDAEATRMVIRATIESSRVRSGLEGTEKPATEPGDHVSAGVMNSPRTATSFKSAAAREPLDDFSRVKRTPIQRLETILRESPAAPELYAQLTALYLEKGRDHDAERMLTDGVQATDNDPQVLKLWEDVVMLRRAKRVTLAEQDLARDATPEKRAHLAEAIVERARVDLEMFTSRCQRDPENAELRIELGLRLKRASKIQEACKQFQEALDDKAHRGPAAFELAECLRELDRLAEALRFYRLAIESARASHQRECRQRALLEAGRLASRVKLQRLARRYLTEFLELDPAHAEAKSLLSNLKPGGV